MDVAADEEDAVADALEDEDPLLSGVERMAALADAAGDGDRAEDRLIELARLDLRVQLFVLVVEPEEAVVLLGPLDDSVEFGESLALAVAVGDLPGRPTGVADGRQGDAA